ncbi:MAG TPA: HlyC/CorC family transporter [Saprospirales bacterium]|nr:HlyC/CorC family transporter [Saprospirales bacterium]
MAGRVSALRIGSHTFPATLLLLAISTLATWWLLPLFSYLLGTGPIAVIVVLLLIFGVMLLFKSLIFKGIYKNPHLDGEAALLEYLVQQNQSGAPGEEEVEMELLENALHLKQVRAHDCMAPRNEIIHIDVNASVAELREKFIQSRLSRIVVTAGGDLDRILGYVHVQQLFRQPKDIHSIVMPITFVPVSIQANDLLNKFVKNRTNIACVVDEYGSIAGLVTMEDALEQLFGEIDDEHDQEEFIEIQVSDQEFMFSGRLEIQYLNEKYPQLGLPEGDYNTLSGYIVSATQTIPEQGLRIKLDGKTFLLELVSDRKIETIRVMV